MHDIAFLVYAPDRQRRKNNSFDGNDNVGAYVIIEVLERAGHKVAFCGPATAHRYRVVLVSFTSTYDLYAFYRAVALRPDWQPDRRPFVVVGGGFGLQNPTVVRHYVDYAVFGRGEDIVADLVGQVVGGGQFTHESVMRLPEIYSVKVAQARQLYHGPRFKEAFIGCPNKCKFCHYTWARRSMGNGGQYVQDTLTHGNSPEILFKQIGSISRKYGRIRTAIDGFSERLRVLYGKKITNQEIVDGFNHIGAFAGNTVVICYNIGNMPTETESDRAELYDLFKRIKPRHRVIVVLHTTPFRPSLLTPLQFAPVQLDPSASALRFKEIVSTGTFMAKHSMSNEGPFSHLQCVVAERATPATDRLFHTICFSKKLRSQNSNGQVRLLEAHFDLSPYLRRYDPTEVHAPGWFLESYVPTRMIRKAFLWTEKDPAGRRGRVAKVKGL